MPEYNPLNEDGTQQALEETNAEEVNVRKQKIISIPQANGQNQEIILSETTSAPDGNGTYDDTTTNHLVPDATGRVLPQDAEKSIIAFSHSGVVITSTM